MDDHTFGSLEGTLAAKLLGVARFGTVAAVTVGGAGLEGAVVCDFD